MQLDKVVVEKLFVKYDHQADVLIDLYRMVYPNYDQIKKIDGFPHVNRETTNWFFDKFIDFDKLNHPEVMAGGMWMNNGFGTSHDEKLDFMQVVKDCKVILYEYSPRIAGLLEDNS